MVKHLYKVITSKVSEEGKDKYFTYYFICENVDEICKITKEKDIFDANEQIRKIEYIGDPLDDYVFLDITKY